MEYIVSIVTGDMGGDGHSQYDTHYFKTNYPYDEIEKAYEKAVEVTGIDLYDECSEYEENKLTDDCMEALDKFGVKLNDKYMGPDKFADLVMNFVSLGLPKDYQFEETGIDAPCIGEFAYGLYY